jgi:hypothetical protein
MIRGTVVTGVLLVLLSGCKDEGTSGRLCTTEARAGIQVNVRDALTGDPAAEGAIAYAQDGAYVDTLHALPTLPPQLPLTLVGVFERPGVYTVVVQKAGYREWRRTNVVVTADECHVITVTLEARLERL